MPFDPAKLEAARKAVAPKESGGFDPAKLEAARMAVKQPESAPGRIGTALEGYREGFASGLAGSPLAPGSSISGKVGHFIGEAGPVAIGAGLGTPGGPVGMAIGGALGKLAQKTTAAGLGAAERVLGTPESERKFQGGSSALGAAGEVATTGMVQGTLGAALGFAGAAMNTQTAKAIGRKLAEGGGQVLRIVTNVKPGTGAAALSDLEKFTNAPSEEAVSSAYKSFYDRISAALGRVVKGRKELIAESTDPFETVGRSVKEMRKAHNALNEGRLDIQEAINASQAARKVRDMKMRGNEFAQEVAETADDLKDKFDDFIEANAPQSLKGEWQRVREMNFWKEVRSEFNTALPQNVNQFPNALRGNLGLAGGAVAGAMGGGPIGAAIGAGVGLAAQSPALYGFGMEGAYYGLKAGQQLGTVAARNLSEKAPTQSIELLKKEYDRRRLGPR